MRTTDQALLRVLVQTPPHRSPRSLLPVVYQLQTKWRHLVSVKGEHAIQLAQTADFESLQPYMLEFGKR